MRLKAGDARHRRAILTYENPQDILNAAITDREVERCKLTSPQPFLVRYAALNTDPCAEIGCVDIVQRNVAVCAIYGSLKVSKKALRMPAAYDLEIRNIR